MVGIQKGFFRLPPQKDTPILCIGPGTGIAPIRSLIEQRIHDGSSGIFFLLAAQVFLTISPANVLYFGCRSAAKDQHYGLEWRQYAQSQNLTYRAAFSRDLPEGTKRVYVQDLMQQDAEDIWKLIGPAGAWVYISGYAGVMYATHTTDDMLRSSNKMPTAVKNAIKGAAEIFGGYTSEDASKYVEKMIQEGRLIEECWS